MHDMDYEVGLIEKLAADLVSSSSANLLVDWSGPRGDMAANNSSQMWQTMSIASAGESVLRAAPRRAATSLSSAAGRSTSMSVGDIAGAAPRSKQRMRAGPTDLTLRTDDVKGAAPATLHRSYNNKPDYALNTHDIDGTYAFSLLCCQYEHDLVRNLTSATVERCFVPC
jgi:hypothetical protein